MNGSVYTNMIHYEPQCWLQNLNEKKNKINSVLWLCIGRQYKP